GEPGKEGGVGILEEHHAIPTGAGDGGAVEKKVAGGGRLEARQDIYERRPSAAPRPPPTEPRAPAQLPIATRPHPTPARPPARPRDGGRTISRGGESPASPRPPSYQRNSGDTRSGSAFKSGRGSKKRRGFQGRLAMPVSFIHVASRLKSSQATLSRPITRSLRA